MHRFQLSVKFLATPSLSQEMAGNTLADAMTDPTTGLRCCGVCFTPTRGPVMTAPRIVFTHLALFAGLLLAPFAARAAESYDNCAGFIDALPTTIATQGMWCLRHDLSTAITSGNAITINTNNVTIDCNDFKVGGLAAGLGTQANGIYALNRLNATVRHCNIRGFLVGVRLLGTGGGHVVEDDRFDNNTYVGVWVEGDGSVLRRNQVTDTGSSTALPGFAKGIHTNLSVDVLDNTISGVLPSADGSGNGDATGIHTDYNSAGSLTGNRVRGLVRVGGGGTAYGIVNDHSGRISLDRNHVVYEGSGASTGLYCADSSGRAARNIVNGFGSAIQNCSNDGNVVH
jgi:hypothetical protein